MNLKFILSGIVAVLGICLVFYFSWLPDPNIGLKSYFPTWLGQWTNRNPNIRTAVPFVFLGFLGEFLPFKITGTIKKRILIFLGLFLIVTLAELGQLLLPLRHFDIFDIGWGGMGSILGIGLGILGNTLHHE